MQALDGPLLSCAEVEFLGHKAALLPQIMSTVAALAPSGSRIADVFSGTGAVSAALRGSGYLVDANDILPLCVNWAKARLLVSRTPRFAGLESDLGNLGPKPLETVISHINGLEPRRGWITENYTPVARDLSGVQRQYFSARNGEAIDAAREQISGWSRKLTEGEHALLLAMLVTAVMEVSNTAGTYGSYLKKWKACALRPLVLRAVYPGRGSASGHRVTADDALTAAAETQASVVYADPPYTKRQYAAYYHVLNSLILNDHPSLTGSTGLPEWQRWSSDWCYSKRAPGELEKLVASTSNKALVLSYSSDGHIDHDSIIDIMSTNGRVSFMEITRKRYKSSIIQQESHPVIERIYVVHR